MVVLRERLLLSFLFIDCVLVTGLITSFGLWLDGVQILNSSSTQRFFAVDGLDPWSRHVLRLQACTARGCGKGPMVSHSVLHINRGSVRSQEHNRSISEMKHTTLVIG